MKSHLPQGSSPRHPAGYDTERSYFASSQMIAITAAHNNQPRLQYVHTKVVVVVEVMGMIILPLSIFGGGGGCGGGI